MKQTVTAIITTYKTAHLLPRCVESVLAQTHPVDEILVVDDASGDGAAEALAPYGDAVRLIERTVNSGAPSAPRNDGIRAATGEWLALLDADDRWLPEKIERQLATAEQHTNAGLIYCDCIQVLPDGTQLKNYHHNKKPVSGQVLDALIEDIFILPSSVMVRKNEVTAINGFDEEIIGAEDCDLYFRLSLNKVEFWLTPEPLVLYERQPTSLSRDHLKMLRHQSRVWSKLLSENLTGEQKKRVRHYLAGVYCDLAFRQRGSNWGRSVKDACMYVRYAPLKPVAWKLLLANASGLARSMPAEN